jgi:hypothetical protein
MPPRIRLVFLGLSVVLLAIAVVPIYSELTRRSDIWWTPPGMLVPLDEAKDRVQIYARGRPLDGLIQAGQLRIAEDGSSSVLQTSDIGLRLNNWDRIRSERFPGLLISAAGFGIGAMMFLLILTGRLAYRGETEPAAP